MEVLGESETEMRVEMAFAGLKFILRDNKNISTVNRPIRIWFVYKQFVNYTSIAHYLLLVHKPVINPLL